VRFRDGASPSEKARFRCKGADQLKVPTYEAWRENPAKAEAMLDKLRSGVSTREYQDVLPSMGATVGASRSAVKASGHRRKPAATERVAGTAPGRGEPAGYLRGSTTRRRPPCFGHCGRGSGQDFGEDVKDVFTLQRLNVPPSLRRCLETTELDQEPAIRRPYAL
jgi:hypothetical protein